MMVMIMVMTTDQSKMQDLYVDTDFDDVADRDVDDDDVDDDTSAHQSNPDHKGVQGQLLGGELSFTPI